MNYNEYVMSNLYANRRKDIESIIRYLKIHDPDNSSREDALEMLAYMQAIAKNLVNQDIKQAELFKQALDVKIKENAKKAEPEKISPLEHQESA